MQAADQAAQRQDDVGDVFAHARHGRELVLDTLDAHGGDRRALSEDSSTRRSELPKVWPKPRSSGSTSKVPSVSETGS